ncbi:MULTISPECIES: EAL domain-containing protein [Arthrobacter]|nr:MULTISPECIES: EAL domain-containing protein [Arthrobacter]QYF90456.1 EAL domain-containing protein [Arthrobacter sp. PAMC25284]
MDSSSIPARSGNEPPPGPDPGAPRRDDGSETPRFFDVDTESGPSDPVPAQDSAGDRLRESRVAGPGHRETVLTEYLAPGSRTAAAATPAVGVGEFLTGRLLLTAFQPILDLSTGAIAGVEAFTRFAGDGSDDAQRWFAAAARAGLGRELEFAALESALCAAVHLPPHLYVALKVSPAVCLDPLLPGLFHGSALAPDRTVLQLTEPLTDAQLTALATVLAPLRRQGVRLAVDHVGSYADSIRHIRELEPDIIKIDRNLIAGIDTDYLRHAFGDAMAGFAGKLGATLVVEGIETAAELTTVRSLGMTAGQGYFLGRPTTSPEDWAHWHHLPEES